MERPMMTVLRSDDGLTHVISDGPSPSCLYALCDIVDGERQDQEFLGAKISTAIIDRKFQSWSATVPHRNWGHDDPVEAVLSCLACISAMQAMVGGAQ